VRALVVLISLFSLSSVRYVRGQSGGCQGSSWNGYFAVTWWSNGRRCVRKIIGLLTCAVALVCPRYENYSQTALMCKDRETLLVLLFEFRFRLLVKDCVGVDIFL
jgi:hypothetical protein